MINEHHAHETHEALLLLRKRLEALHASSSLGLPVSTQDVFELLGLARLSDHHAARAIPRVAQQNRRNDRLPPFDGVEDAQLAVAQSPEQRAITASVSAEIRRALVRES